MLPNLYRKIFKPSVDFLLALVMLIVLIPLMGIIAIIITINMKTFPIFTQNRPGMNGKIFCMYKFKTMKDLASKSETIDDRIRLTNLGLFLRKYSLDELPELLNILKGEMSFVGPRPLLVEYLQEYTGEQNKRHDVKPGLTGWAQVNGRNEIEWTKKFEYDIFYVDNISLVLDLKILLRTIGVLLSSDQITHPGSSTMPKFKRIDQRKPKI